MQRKLPLDVILSFCRDAIPGKGEDSYCYSFCDTAGLLGVFDGCGGAGARTHALYSGRTEAYMASRLCAGAFYDSFRETFPCDKTADSVAVEVLGKKAVQRLSDYQPPKDPNAVLGSMVRTLPTTVAAAVVQQTKEEELLVSAVWAGDSRVYILDSQGLAQLTVDDTSVPDPMDNIYEDGVLKNMFCSDRKVRIHCRTVRIKPPFAVLAATDGCFGYVSTPMEFEGMILGNLMSANSPAQWESMLAEQIGRFAGDDHTLCLAAFGYRKFANLQNSLLDRYHHLVQAYLQPVSTLPVEDRQSRYDLWKQYRGNYLRYLEDDQV